MAMIGNMAKGWRNKARVAKERRDAISKAAQDMQTPAQRAAARNAQKGFWNSAPELSEEEKAEAEKRSLAEVERLQAGKYLSEESEHRVYGSTVAIVIVIFIRRFLF
jgi:hypothetical protein